MNVVSRLISINSNDIKNVFMLSFCSQSNTCDLLNPSIEDKVITMLKILFYLVINHFIKQRASASKPIMRYVYERSLTMKKDPNKASESLFFDSEPHDYLGGTKLSLDFISHSNIISNENDDSSKAPASLNLKVVNTQSYNTRENSLSAPIYKPTQSPSTFQNSITSGKNVTLTIIYSHKPIKANGSSSHMLGSTDIAREDKSASISTIFAQKKSKSTDIVNSSKMFEEKKSEYSALGLVHTFSVTQSPSSAKIHKPASSKSSKQSILSSAPTKASIMLSINQPAEIPSQSPSPILESTALSHDFDKISKSYDVSENFRTAINVLSLEPTSAPGVVNNSTTKSFDKTPLPSTYKETPTHSSLRKNCYEIKQASEENITETRVEISFTYAAYTQSNDESFVDYLEIAFLDSLMPPLPDCVRNSARFLQNQNNSIDNNISDITLVDSLPKDQISNGKFTFG